MAHPSARYWISDQYDGGVATDSDLGRIPGNFIAAGSRDLPRPDAGVLDQTVELDCGVWGRFRVRYTAVKNHRGGRSTYWFWAADHADRVD